MSSLLLKYRLQLLFRDHDAVVRLVLELVEEVVLAHHVPHHRALLLGPVRANGALKGRLFLAFVLLVPPKRSFRFVHPAASQAVEGTT